jgi:hypothetical protein
MLWRNLLNLRNPNYARLGKAQKMSFVLLAEPIDSLMV